MKREYKKLLDKIDEITINSLSNISKNKSKEEIIKDAIYIHSPKKIKGKGFELCWLNKGDKIECFCNISIFENNYGEIIFSHGYNYYGEMLYQHKMERHENKTILLLDYVFKNCEDEAFLNRVRNYILFNESDKVKNHFR
jgi:hypothetical protein